MTELILIDNNPAVEPDILDTFETNDGFKIRYAIFRGRKRPVKGTILLLQGRNEAIEKYFETIGDLTKRGFDVATFDWRGQGGSSRFFSNPRRGHIDGYSQYQADLDQFFTQVALPECRAPFFILAHSMGCLAALYAAPLMVNRVRRMMLCSPFLGIADDTLSPTQISVLASSLSFVGLGSMHMGGSPRGIAAMPFEKNRVTTDPKRYARNRELMDPDLGLGLGSATAGWLNASAKAMEYVREIEHLAQIHIPILMVSAGADRVVSISSIEDYAQRLRSGALISIDGARHELMQESDRYRDQFFAAFDAFIPGTEL